MDKQTIRSLYLEVRNNIQDKEIKSKKITKKIIETNEYKKAKVIALYKNLKSEVSTDELINYSLRIGKIVVLPKVTDNNLIFYKINKDTNFIKSNFGVLEPDNNNYISKEDIDLVITPGICFDKYKNRVGFGKGYYDRFLEGTNLKTIGICFQEQITNDVIETTYNDIKMDLIITDKCTIR